MVPATDNPGNLTELPSPETLHQWDRDHLWHPFEPHDPLDPRQSPLFVAGEGCWLIDSEGNRLLDGVSSLWCNLHGHRVPRIDQAVRDQLARLAHATLLGAANVPAVQLARKLVEVAPRGLQRVFFSDDGATAVEAALKIAFQYQQQRPDPKPGKNRYLALNEAYHGDTLGAVAVGDIPRFHRQFGPLLFPVHRACQAFCYRCPLGKARPACNLACADEAVGLIERHADTLAAVIVEPVVQGAAGMVVAPEGWLGSVARACKRHDVLLIADEVATGFGRTGKLFACEHEGVTPDLLCLAKGITGGYLPLAATLATDQVFQAFCGPASAGRAFYHGHTYSGNPLGAAAALASLEILLEPGYLEAVEKKGRLLEDALAPLLDHPRVGEIRRKGLMLGVELVANRQTREPLPPARRTGRAVCDHARGLGVLLRPLGDVVVLMPPLAIQSGEIGHLADAVIRSIHQILPAGEIG
jgi:adenosylmethionine-8-amino-7-oxononanoate aminotransferase